MTRVKEQALVLALALALALAWVLPQVLPLYQGLKARRSKRQLQAVAVAFSMAQVPGV